MANTHNLFKRGGTWYFDGYLEGRRVKKSLKTDVLKEAKFRRDQILENKDEYLRLGGRKTCTIEQLAGRYLTYSEAHKAKSTHQRNVWILDSVLSHWPPTTSTKLVTTDEARQFQVRARAKYADRTVNDLVSGCVTVWKWAIKEDIISGQNPWMEVPKIKLEQKVPIYLTKEQRARVLRASKDRGRDIYLFCALCLYAGLRTGEAGAARWEWINWEQGSVTVQTDGQFKTKSREHRTIPLASGLREILEPIREDSGFILLPHKEGYGAWRVRYEPRKALATVIRDAEIPSNITAHTLRHTFASLLAQAGVDLYKIGRWMGHKDPKTTQIYAHLAPGDRAIDALE